MNKVFPLIVISFLAFSCKSAYTTENLPKPLPQRPIQNENSDTLTAEESKELDSLKTNITTIASGEKCVNAAEWKSIGIGVKPCGGPVAYLAYSIKIDEKDFLEKVDFYNQKMDAYNKKYNLTSDCMLVAQPANIVCEGDKAVFK